MKMRPVNAATAPPGPPKRRPTTMDTFTMLGPGSSARTMVSGETSRFTTNQGRCRLRPWTRNADQASAAAGYQAGREQATGDLVVFVHQDVYLPRGWDSQLIEQFAAAERRSGPIGVAGAFGVAVDGGVVPVTAKV